ncbi:hypothetical protein J6590_003130 [Homalodisca vitripennis]|nr:hypothetical protein J6590_003130 [Homalodisca vitripennis]
MRHIGASLGCGEIYQCKPGLWRNISMQAWVVVRYINCKLGLWRDISMQACLGCGETYRCKTGLWWNVASYKGRITSNGIIKCSVVITHPYS